MIKQERVQATIPADHKWHNADIDKKAKEFGLKKGDFILFAVDFILNLEKGTLKYIDHYAKGLKIPFHLVVQNLLIDRMAKEDAKSKVYGPGGAESLNMFIHTIDDKGPRTLTGKELYEVLKASYIQEFETKKKNFDIK